MERLARRTEQCDRDLASAAVRARRSVVWFERHPHVAVLGLLGVVTILALAVSSAIVALFIPAAPVPGELDAPVVVPSPAQRPPQERVDAVHGALHALGKLCNQPEVNRGRRLLTRRFETVRKFAAQYPSGGFAIDGESGTTLGLLIVVRHELETCDPMLVRKIDAMVPPQFRAN